MLRPRERVQLVPGERDWDSRPRPTPRSPAWRGRSTGSSPRAGPATSRSGTGRAGAGRGRSPPRAPSSPPWPGTPSPTVTVEMRVTPFVRGRTSGRRPGRRGVPAPHGLQRRGRARARRGLRGAAADRQGAGDRAARRPPARARRLPAPDRAELGERVATELLRSRFARRPRSSSSSTPRTSSSAVRASRPPTTASLLPRCSTPGSDATVTPAELELLRIRARHRRAGAASWTSASCPRRRGSWSAPSSFEKGCYPGQEPIARLHYRGHANRGLRVLALDELPAAETEIVYDGKSVGRITSAAALPTEPSPSPTFAARSLQTRSGRPVGGDPATLTTRRTA